jgi:hypothetical protein
VAPRVGVPATPPSTQSASMLMPTPPCLVEVALVLVESLVFFPVAGKGWVAGLVGGVLESVPVREPDVVRGVMVREAAARDMSVISDPGLP